MNQSDEIKISLKREYDLHANAVAFYEKVLHEFEQKYHRSTDKFLEPADVLIIKECPAGCDLPKLLVMVLLERSQWLSGRGAAWPFRTGAILHGIVSFLSRIKPGMTDPGPGQASTG